MKVSGVPLGVTFLERFPAVSGFRYVTKRHDLIRPEKKECTSDWTSEGLTVGGLHQAESLCGVFPGLLCQYMSKFEKWRGKVQARGKNARKWSLQIC